MATQVFSEPELARLRGFCGDPSEGAVSVLYQLKPWLGLDDRLLERLRVSAGELAADYLGLPVAQLRVEGTYVTHDTPAHIFPAVSGDVSLPAATTEVDTEFARPGRAGYRPLGRSTDDGSGK